MTTSLIAYRCPACRTRFALEGDGDPGGGGGPHCPGCGQTHGGLQPLVSHEVEVWAMWATLEDCLGQLPGLVESLAGQEDDTIGSPLPERGLVGGSCPACGVRSWLAPGLNNCPHCGDGRVQG
ncbi:MAG: hypothetical protein Q8O14_09750 [bacterium]|jgi:DNA-directed RNA polymerase subunit RPC12/RpoP|nr:hypothetical protein [bacterium]